MKLLAYMQLILIMLLSPLLTTISVSAQANPNLIDNPSTEVLVNNLPKSWNSNSWGTNTANFSRVTSGNTGSALRTEVTSYTSGDAKWYPTAVAVTAGAEYAFGEFYRSNASSEVVIQYTHADNSNSYEWLETAPVSPTWRQLTYTVIVPTNAVKISVFHVMASVGWLEVDDFSLSKTATDPIPDPVCEDATATNHGGSLPCVYPNPDPGNNLVQNPSLEQANNQNTLPVKWLSNNWGTNSATFAYSNDAHTGNKSVTTNVVSYTDGDAKWYFEQTAVTEGETYSYSHFYKSNAVSEVVLQFTNQSGVTSYQYVGGLSASSTSWSKFQTSIVIPSGAVKLSVFHVLATVGQLSLDDASLVLDMQSPPSSNPVPNSSLETASGAVPAQWNNNKWGTNTSAFTYVNEGKTGQKSVKATTTSYTSGDAKWYFNPVALNQGEEYRFGVWYKTNITPQAVAMFELQNGTTIYQGLPTPQPASNSTSVWQEYSETFSVPSDAVSTSVFLFIDSVGWLQTDDYTIAPYQAQGFNRALISLTFDDGHEENTETALPIMQSHGLLSTQCYATTFIEDADNEQQAINDVLTFRDAGHEICSHTVTHPFLTQISESEADYELSHSKQYLESITGQSILNFASPYGDYNTSVNDIIDNYYQAHRTVDAGYNSKDSFDIYRLKVQNMLSTTTVAELQSWIDHAAATNTWLILVYHRVANDPGAYDTYTSDFAEQMQVVANSGLTVKTYNDALLELVPQL